MCEKRENDRMEEFMNRYRNKSATTIFDIESNQRKEKKCSWESLRMEMDCEIKSFTDQEIGVDKISTIRKKLSSFLGIQEEHALIKNNKYDWIKIVKLFCYVDKFWYPVQEYMKWKEKNHRKSNDEYRLRNQSIEGKKRGFFNSLTRLSIENVPMETILEYSLDKDRYQKHTLYGDKILYLKSQLELKLSPDAIIELRSCVRSSWENRGEIEKIINITMAIISEKVKKEDEEMEQFLEQYLIYHANHMEKMKKKIESDFEKAEISSEGLYEHVYGRLLIYEMASMLSATMNLGKEVRENINSIKGRFSNEQARIFNVYADESVVIASYEELIQSLTNCDKIENWFSYNTEWNNIYKLLSEDAKRYIKQKQGVLKTAVGYLENFERMNRTKFTKVGCPVLTVVAAIECAVWVYTYSADMKKPVFRRDYIDGRGKTRTASLKQLGEREDDLSVRTYLIQLIHDYELRLCLQPSLYNLYEDTMNILTNFYFSILYCPDVQSLLKCFEDWDRMEMYLLDEFIKIGMVIKSDFEKIDCLADRQKNNSHLLRKIREKLIESPVSGARNNLEEIRRYVDKELMFDN